MTSAPIVLPTALPPAPPPTLGSISNSELAAKFPTQVDGNPVPAPTVVRFIDFARAMGQSPDEVEAIRAAFAAVSVNLENIVFANATATVDDSSVGLIALQIPGQDASVLIPILSQLGAVNEGDTLSTETIGGKTVTVERSEGGYASDWYYVNGDIVWNVNTSDEDEAAAVFSALP
ncbi:MAG: hypothetical protein ABIP53_03645 [Candidatus Limnocylindrales bacterium]